MSDPKALLESLTTPLAEDGPCGPDLTYDADFQAFQRAAEGTPERISGDEVKPAEPPDWAVVEPRAVKLLGRSKDLRVAIVLARAWLTSGGLAGFASGLELLQRLTEQFWDEIHPRADEDGDLVLRFNSLRSLIDDGFLLNPLRLLPLAGTRQLGRFTLRDVRIVTGKLKLPEGSTETPPERSRIEAISGEADVADLQASLGEAKRAVAALAALQKLLDEKAPGYAPSFQPLQADLRDITRVYDETLAKRSGLESAPGEGGDGTAPAGDGAGGAGISGAVRSRADVVKALDAVCAYYRDREPSSPIPMLLTRAKRLVNLSFLEIVRDLTPSAVSEAESLAGVEKAES